MVNDLPGDFMCSDSVTRQIQSVISKLELETVTTEQMNNVYDMFCDVVKTEMSDKLPCKRITVYDGSNNKKKRIKKPWWTEELTVLWNDMCVAEKNWVKTRNKKEFKSVFIMKRKTFDKEVQRSKRRHWYKLQSDILTEMKTDRATFWKKIGKIGVGDKRRNPIPMEVITKDGTLSRELADVLKKWDIA